MKHIAWFDFLGDVLGQKTIKTHCGLRVKYGAHVNRTNESDCPDCVHAIAISARILELYGQSALKGRNPYDGI